MTLDRDTFATALDDLHADLDTQARRLMTAFAARTGCRVTTLDLRIDRDVSLRVAIELGDGWRCDVRSVPEPT